MILPNIGENLALLDIVNQRSGQGVSSPRRPGSPVVSLLALLHVGVRIPVGFAVIQEPSRPFAVLVEGVAALLALGASAVLTPTTWGWAAVTGAHAVALAGVLWGMVAIAAGRGSHTQLNDTYHRVMVVVLGAGLLLLLTRRGRAVVDISKPGPDPGRE